MTQYPYYISSSISTATTHSQYYQLAMEEDSNHDGTNDIVVWFCLKNGKENAYTYSPNDVRNNYYFYSKGNVIYTGVGHKTGITQQEQQLLRMLLLLPQMLRQLIRKPPFLMILTR